jgi:hypothetical protein
MKVPGILALCDGFIDTLRNVLGYTFASYGDGRNPFIGNQRVDIGRREIERLRRKLQHPFDARLRPAGQCDGLRRRLRYCWDYGLLDLPSSVQAPELVTLLASPG